MSMAFLSWLYCRIEQPKMKRAGEGVRVSSDLFTYGFDLFQAFITVLPPLFGH